MLINQGQDAISLTVSKRALKPLTTFKPWRNKKNTYIYKKGLLVQSSSDSSQVRKDASGSEISNFRCYVLISLFSPFCRTKKVFLFDKFCGKKIPLLYPIF